MQRRCFKYYQMQPDLFHQRLTELGLSLRCYRRPGRGRRPDEALIPRLTGMPSCRPRDHVLTREIPVKLWCGHCGKRIKY